MPAKELSSVPANSKFIKLKNGSKGDPAKLISKSGDLGAETYEIEWTIPNWREVRKSERLVNLQGATFKTGTFPSSSCFQTKWLLGLKLVPGGSSGRKVRACWKLLEIKGSEEENLEVKFETQLWNHRRDKPHFTEMMLRVVELFEELEEISGCLQFKPDSIYSDGELICSKVSVRFTLKLNLEAPAITDLEYGRYKMKQLHKKTVKKLCDNQAVLLNDSGSADLKFFCRDGVEIPAHKTILRAQCPVFAAMMNCDLSENVTGIIRISDISGETMIILLHYVYSGELLPSWLHPDIIVEFTYAAGKYQLTGVLELLDDLLGSYCGGDASNLDVQLIDLAGKLKLEKAEARLLKRIVDKIKKLKTGRELFDLFGYGQEEIEKMAEDLGTEQVAGSKILRFVDYYLIGSLRLQCESIDLYEKGLPLLALVLKEELKTVEKASLKRFAGMAQRMDNADKLFELFGRGKEMEK